MGSNPDVLLLYSHLFAKLERNGYGLAVPVPSVSPEYYKYKDRVIEFATGSSSGEEEDLADNKKEILAQDKGAWAAAVSLLSSVFSF
jgi:hypothetical protein